MRPPHSPHPRRRATLGRSAAAALLLALLPHTAAAQAGRPDFREPGSAPRTTPQTPGSQPARDIRETAALVDLRPRFKLGDDQRYIMTVRGQSALVTADTPPTPRGGRAPAEPADKQTIEQEITLVLSPREVQPEGGAAVELRIERVKAKLTQGGEVFEFDSAAKPASATDPLDAAAAEILKTLVGQSAGSKATLTFDNDGRITRVDTPAQSPAVNGLGLGAPSPVEALFGPVVSRSTPPGLARVGDTWINDDRITLGPAGELELKTRHELRAHRGGQAAVHFSGDIRARTDGPTPMFHVEHASHRGRYDWDAKRGRLAGMESELDARISMKGGAGGGVAGAMTSSTVVRVRPAP
jgi:hypothetical protein